MFEHKDYVEAIFQEKSFGKAAERIHISQPALSALIKRLEKELGAPLFNRKTTPISLTPFGAEYLKSAGIVTDLENRLKNMAYDVNALLTGDLTLCAFSLGISYRITEQIAAFHARYPQIRLHLQDHNTLQSKQMVDAYQGDLLLSTKPLSSDKYVRIPIYEECLVLVVPRAFTINEKYREKQLRPADLDKKILEPECPSISLSNFSKEPFVLATRQNYIRTCTDSLFQEVRINPPHPIDAESSAICLNFALLGSGCTICSHQLLAHMEYEDKVCVYKIRSPLAHRTGSLYYRKGAYVTPAMEAFIEMFKTGA